MPSLKEAALNYAKLGYAVFPLKPKTKEPATTHGFYEASTDAGTIEAWWVKNPDYNIGIACGNGLAVIDIDQHPEDGKFGLDTLRTWEKDHGELQPTWTVLTGTGGLHYWYKTDLSFKNVVEVLPGIDIRSKGAYVVAPPSIHPNGTEYEWEASGDPTEVSMAELDGSALELASLAKEKKKKDPSAPAYKQYEVIGKGRRQDALMSLMGHLKNLNLTDDAIKDAVRRENEAKCDPPMSEEELRKEIFPFLKRNIEANLDYADTVAPSLTMFSDDDLSLPTLAEIPQEKAEWLERGYIPAKSITILCGTGGVGKTTLWCSLAAAVSRGEATFLTSSSAINIGQFRQNRTVLFFSAEDSVSVVLSERLTKAHAVMENIRCLDVSDERFKDIKFSSLKLEKVIDKYRPALCIFDPIQAFIDKRVKMSDRNAMRQEIEPLIKLGQKYGTTFLIVMHTNKQKNVWGRQRMADSADIWDVARSVLMVGETSQEGFGYVSQEKNSYARQAQTIIFKNEGGVVTRYAATQKKDRDFVLEASKNNPSNGSDSLQDVCNLILSELAEHDGKMLVSELTEELLALDYSKYMIRTAKQELKKANKIVIKKDGYEGKNYICTR